MVFVKGNNFYPPNTIYNIWNRIDVRNEDDCWNWMRCKDKKGYGIIGLNNKSCRVNRFIYKEIYGSIPEGLLVCHKCNNPSCCNPNHLYVGTHADNMKQMVDDGRSGKGENNGYVKLTGRDILKIRYLFSTGEYSQRELGEMFGVVQVNISRIVNNKIWKHI